MYAYIDETGNTGANLFDEAQPIFMSGALITKKNFDVVYAEDVNRVASSVGYDSLHASELGLEAIDAIAPQLLEVLKDVEVKVCVCKVVKVDLAATKLADTLFDSGENRAVPWHIYNLRALRLVLVMKVASLLDINTLRIFWHALMERNRDRAHTGLLTVVSILKERVKHLPDARSREVIGDALEWAKENPEAIHVHPNSRALRHGHLPNLAVFPELLGGIESMSKLWGRPVREIKHDRQSQFQGALRDWHELFSNATPDPVYWPVGEKHVLRRVFKSKFLISDSLDSPGIQIIDNLLWLLGKLEALGSLPPNTLALVRYLLTRGFFWELSLSNISDYLSEFFERLTSAPIGKQQMKSAKKLLAVAEQKRLDNMAGYAQRKLPNAQPTSPHSLDHSES